VNRRAKVDAPLGREAAGEACAKQRSGTVNTAARFAGAELAARPGRRKPQLGAQTQWKPNI